MTGEPTKRNGPLAGAVEPTDKPSAGFGHDDSASSSPRQLSKKRVAVFVDGFNLYYGLHELAQRKYLWLDLKSLATSLLKADQRLVAVYYFTARVRNQPAAAARQAEYLGALQGLKVRVVEGRFQEKPQECRSCGVTWHSYEEKESDVNLCVTLMESAFRHEFDVGLIVSGDSDMVPAVKAVRRMSPGLRLVAVFPPKRFSDELKRAVHGSMHLGHAKIRQAQLPAEVADGKRIYKRPSHWQ